MKKSYGKKRSKGRHSKKRAFKKGKGRKGRGKHISTKYTMQRGGISL